MKINTYRGKEKDTKEGEEKVLRKVGENPTIKTALTLLFAIEFKGEKGN